MIQDGGVLLVSTSQGTAGRDVSALVEASILNLVDGVIREQGSVPLKEQRGVLVVVDEMQSMPGVDYETMLSNYAIIQCQTGNIIHFAVIWNWV